ncbi:ABC transporter permease [Chondrinema litorale]|uniref:ABC transporter permease n=1 Tax=Chondrinema litorale TaxID=2994555 RepID=UPI002542E8D9|nr:ABC transporter permease [Chondrinema litorale]UZR97582.1 ABC transporter permease [Chondrinema litorale]
MLWNYIKVFKRNFFKYSYISFVNVFGLATGIATSLLVFMYVTHEYQYDSFHEKADKIYKLELEINLGEATGMIPVFSAGFGPLFKTSIPEVSDYVRIGQNGTNTITFDNNTFFNEENFIFTDPAFLDVFNFNLKAGDGISALTKPNTVLITEKAAQKYFRDKNPIGEIVYLDSQYPFEITGILENPPTNSTIQFNFIAPLSSYNYMDENKRNIINQEIEDYGMLYTYLYIPENENLAKVETHIHDVLAKYNFDVENKQIKFHPLKSIFFKDNQASKKYILAFLCTGFVILLLAITNYTNLVTSQATLRAKETGIRKVIGAKRFTLFFQFLFEAVTMNFLAFAVGIILLHLSLSVFINVLDLPFNSDYIYNSDFILVLCIAFSVCLISGSIYPAFILSKFNSINLIKSGIGKQASGVAVRKFLTLFQFIASIVLICFSLVIQYQVNYLHEQNTGLTKDQVLVLNIHSEIGKSYQTLKHEISNLNGVLSTSTSRTPIYKSNGGLMFVQSPYNSEMLGLNSLITDENFFNTLDINWISKPTLPLQHNNVIINERAFEMLGANKTDIGGNFAILGESAMLTGIVKDFNFMKLDSEISPLVIHIQNDTSQYLIKNGAYTYLRIAKDAKVSDVISEAKNIIKTFIPSHPFEYYFLDDAYDKLYKREEQTASIFQLFTIVAIVIAALGLFGLASFAINKRTKEIGIRKVVGASLVSIFYLLSKEYFKMIFIAFVIAVPIANYFISEWLNEFAYKIALHWWLYALPGLLITGIALLAIGGRIIKAAIVNPVETLKDE